MNISTALFKIQYKLITGKVFPSVDCRIRRTESRKNFSISFLKGLHFNVTAVSDRS